MGSGKSTVGRALAGQLGRLAIDLDTAVEAHAGMSVREIFATRGEAAFRELEHAALLDALRAPMPAVIATGGGTFAIPRNLALIRGSGPSIWLNPPFATIVARIGALGKQDRPLFRNEVEALALYQARLPAYRQADHRVDISADETPDEVAARIALWLRKAS
jgi:shikimate kinase